MTAGRERNGDLAMGVPSDARPYIARLIALRGVFTRVAASKKCALLIQLADQSVRDPRLLLKLHATLCYCRAFPDDARVFRHAGALLRSFGDRVRDVPRRQRTVLDDSGVAGTPIRYGFSFDQATRLASAFEGSAEIDWAAFEDPEALDALLEHLFTPSEEEAFQSGKLTTRQWLRRACGGESAGGFSWIMREVRARITDTKFWRALYDQAEVPLRWNLGDGPGSITNNVLPPSKVQARMGGMRRVPASPKRAIVQSIRIPRPLPRAEARRWIDLAQNALAARHREVYSMDHANERETYVVPLSHGTAIVVFGVVPAWRPVLEGNFGYVLISNGVPIGYGGVSPLFRQANTGISLFEEYRRSEAGFLWVQALRVFHSLFGVTQFVVNPYQFGAQNDDALASGAFWFYYRLGFRPVDRAARMLAEREARANRKNQSRRSDRKVLRTLAGGDMVLALPGAKAGDFFPEERLVVCSAGATDQLVSSNGLSRDRVLRSLRKTLLERIGLRSTATWSLAERAALDRIVPLLMLIDDLPRWPMVAKRELRRLIRMQGGTSAREYCIALRKLDRLRIALGRYCNDVTRRTPQYA